MSTVERLEAAIARLEEVKAIGWPCDEYTREAVRHIARNCDISCDNEDHYEGWDRYKTAPALMVLVATIEPQLAFLRLAVEAIPAWITEDGSIESEIASELARELALANAILGRP